MSFQIKSVLISDDIDSICPEILKENGIEVTEKSKLSLEQLKAEIQNHDALIVRSATKVTKEVIQCAERLKLVGRAGTGVDNVHVEEATKKGIIVMNTPAGNSRSAAELACSMIMNLSRKIPQAHQSMKEGKWDRKGFMGTEVSGKTLAVIGLGRIGREVATRMQAFGMKTIGFDPIISASESEEFGVEWKSLEEIWPIADYITLHVPLIPQTTDLINAEVFTKTKPGLLVTNCARGGIINEDHLLEALQTGVCGGAALDVFCQEPPKNRALLDHPNVICTPHLGASTKEAQFRVAEEIAQQIVALNSGRILGALNARPLVAALDSANVSWINAAQNLSAILAAIGRSPNNNEIKNICLEYPEKCAGMEPALKAAAIIGMLNETCKNGLNLINADTYGKAAGITVSTLKTAEKTVICVSAGENLRICGIPSEAGTILQKIGKNSFFTGVPCTGTMVLSGKTDTINAEQNLGEKYLGFVKSDVVNEERWIATLFEKLTPEETALLVSDCLRIEF